MLTHSAPGEPGALTSGDGWVRNSGVQRPEGSIGRPAHRKGGRHEAEVGAERPVRRSRRGGVRRGWKGRSLLRMSDLSESDLEGLLGDGPHPQGEKAGPGSDGEPSQGTETSPWLFEKLSTRTRCAAIVAAGDEGGRAECLSASEIHLGVKESVADTARVLGRMFDGILFRGYEQARLEETLEHAGVPVWNALTDQEPPDAGAGEPADDPERFGGFRGVKVVVRRGRAATTSRTSLMLGCALAGADLREPARRRSCPTAQDVLHGGRECASPPATGAAVPSSTIRRRPSGRPTWCYTDVWLPWARNLCFRRESGRCARGSG